jgi:hypothetical protein
MSQYFDNKALFVGPKTTQYGSHNVMTNVVKESKKKYINIDSRFRDEYSNSDTCTVTLPDRINDVKNISVCNAEIPMSMYNVSSDLGNHFFKLNVSTITIPSGYYASLEGLITRINATIGDSYIEFGIQQGNLVTIKNTKEQQQEAYTIDFAIDSAGNFDKYYFKSKMGWMLGFTELSYTILPGQTITGEFFANLQGPRYIYLVVDEYSRGNQNSFVAPLSTSFINKNILARIVLDYRNYPYGSILTANLFNGYLLSDKRSYTGKVDLQKLTVQLVNEYGVPVNLNGLDYSFCVEVEHE